MTEQELIEIAKSKPSQLFNIDKSLFTKEVVDNIRIMPVSGYDLLLDGVNPEFISKERALEFIKLSPRVYALLTKDLQNDIDIIETTIRNPYRIPREFFKNDFAVNCLLDKWNATENGWAVAGTGSTYVIIKPDKDVPEYIMYPNGIYSNDYNVASFCAEEIAKAKTPEEEAAKISIKMFKLYMCSDGYFVKRL